MTALYAQLCTSGNGIDPDGILRMTPRQLADIYQHPRDENGQVAVPQPAPDAMGFDEVLAKLRATAAALNVPPDQLAQAEEALRKRYGT